MEGTREAAASSAAVGPDWPVAPGQRSSRLFIEMPLKQSNYSLISTARNRGLRF